MNLHDKHELFKKRWLPYQKHGIVKYSIFLGLLYAFTIILFAVLFKIINTDHNLSEIDWLADQTLILKTIVFFFVGIIFGIYHYKKSERKYNS